MPKVLASFSLVLLLSLAVPAYAQQQSSPGASPLRYEDAISRQQSTFWSESAKPAKEEWGIKLFAAAGKVQDFLNKRNLILNAYLDKTQLLIKIK